MSFLFSFLVNVDNSKETKLHLANKFKNITFYLSTYISSFVIVRRNFFNFKFRANGSARGGGLSFTVIFFSFATEKDYHCPWAHKRENSPI